MKEIPLSQGFIALVDDQDYEELIRYPWYAKKGSRKNSRYYAVNWQIGTMHRYIMGNPKGMQVDHINQDEMDNRRCNLRICTVKENLRNRRPKLTKASKFLGVTPSLKKWQANICVDRKKFYLGTFDSEEEAARIYDIHAKAAFGQFANPNFKSPMYGT